MSKNKNFVALLVELEEALARSTAQQVQAAMLLLVYCNKKRNGGRIPRALVDDRMELATIILAGLKDKLADDCELFHWEDDTLVVDCYSVAYEEKQNGDSEHGRMMANARWKGHKTNKKGKRDTVSNACSIASSNASSNADRQTDRRQSSFSSKKKKTDREDTDTSLSLSGSSDSDGQVSLNSEKETKQETAAADEEPRLSGPEAAAYLRALEAGEIKED